MTDVLLLRHVDKCKEKDETYRDDGLLSARAASSNLAAMQRLLATMHQTRAAAMLTFAYPGINLALPLGNLIVASYLPSFVLCSAEVWRAQTVYISVCIVELSALA